MKSFVSFGYHRSGVVAAGIAFVALAIAAGTLHGAALVAILTAAGLFGAMIVSYARAPRPAVRRHPVRVPAVLAPRQARALRIPTATARA